MTRSSGPNYREGSCQIFFGLGPKSDLVLEPSRIWSWSQLGFGLGPNSDLVSDPNSDLVLDPNSNLVSDPGLSEPGYSEDGYSEVTWNPVTPNRCSTLVISWHLDFFLDFFFDFFFFDFLIFLIFATTSITYFTLLNPMAMYIGKGHILFYFLVLVLIYFDNGHRWKVVDLLIYMILVLFHIELRHL